MMLRVPFEQLAATLENALLPLGFSPERAKLCARLFAETTRDGVYTHGLNRFPRFLAAIYNGSVKPQASPSLTAACGAIERWNGNRGPGNLNAHASMQRAMELARLHGVGAVALAETNHWMRGGTYGWQAAEHGLFGICWTNTLANLPAWGTATPVLGNNPLVIAIPRPAGPVVLDMAMSQFSYGTLAAYAKLGKPLPVPGGYDAAGVMTTDAAAIERTQRALPVGFWKGSGLALTLDLLAAMLADGNATYQIPRDPARETGQSQVFLAFDAAGLGEPSAMNAIADAVLADLKLAVPLDSEKPVRYPGEQTLATREENLRLGVPVDADIWASLKVQKS